jgi:hypothetical protein
MALLGWGLQSKLAVYHSLRPIRHSGTPKLFTEKYSSHTAAAIQSAMELPPASPEILLLLLAVWLPAASFSALQARQATVSLSRPCTCDCEDPDLMRRPPPTTA